MACSRSSARAPWAAGDRTRRWRTLRRARAHGGAATAAHRQAQRVQQDGFARAGLAGQHIEAGREFQRGLLDQNDVADRQRGEASKTLSEEKSGGKLG